MNRHSMAVACGKNSTGVGIVEELSVEKDQPAEISSGKGAHTQTSQQVC